MTLSALECLRLIVIMVTKQYLTLTRSLAYDDAVLVEVIRRFIDELKKRRVSSTFDVDADAVRHGRRELRHILFAA
jgi:hypothetical protein